MPDLRSVPRAALGPARSPAGAGSRLLEAVGTSVVRAASFVRGERVIHAKGMTLHARLTVPASAGTGAPLFDEPRTWPALVRLSRSVGLPERLPDVLGIAIRVPDAYGPDTRQDLLMSSAVRAPVLRHLPLPRFDLLGATYSSLTPYEIGTERGVLWAVPEGEAPSTRDVQELPGRGDGTRLVLQLVSSTREPRTLAVVELAGEAPGGREIRFAPLNTGGGIRPVGWLQDLRRSAYPASHVGRDD